MQSSQAAVQEVGREMVTRLQRKALTKEGIVAHRCALLYCTVLVWHTEYYFAFTVLF